MLQHKPWTDLLNELFGMSADEIAAYLRQRDIKGIRANSTNCPLARYFTDLYGELFCFSASAGPANRLMERLTIFGSVDEFIQNFDEGKYPDLILAEESDHAKT